MYIIRWVYGGNFLFYVLLILTLTSCNLSSPDTQEQESSPNSPAIPFVPEGGAPSAPMSTGEEVDCNYYVSPDGDDDGPGSQAQPWASFQFAADSIQPGNTVCFREGAYIVEDAIQVIQSGVANSPILFIAYPGERPILDGGNEIGDLLISTV